MSKTRKKTVIVATDTVDGAREYEVLRRFGNYAALRVPSGTNADTGAPVYSRGGPYSITHIPTGMRLMWADTRPGAILAARLANEKMPKALDALRHGAQATSLDRETRAQCIDAKNEINAERLALKGEV